MNHRLHNCVMRACALTGKTNGRDRIAAFVTQICKVVHILCRGSAKANQTWAAVQQEKMKQEAQQPGEVERVLRLVENNATRWLGLHLMCVRILRVYSTLHPYAQARKVRVPAYDTLAEVVAVLQLVYSAHMNFQGR